MRTTCIFLLLLITIQNYLSAFFYGCTGEKPENGKVASSGYFVQKYSFFGERQWSSEGKFSETGNTTAAPEFVSNNSETCYPGTSNVNLLYRNFPVLSLGLDTLGGIVLKTPLEVKPVKKDFSQAGQITQFDNSRIYGFYHFEIMQTQVFSKLVAPAAAAALHKFLETNGHPASWYLIQVNNNAFTVLETDPVAEAYTVWTVGY